MFFKVLGIAVVAIVVLLFLISLVMTIVSAVKNKKNPSEKSENEVKLYRKMTFTFGFILLIFACSVGFVFLMLKVITDAILSTM